MDRADRNDLAVEFVNLTQGVGDGVGEDGEDGRSAGFSACSAGVAYMGEGSGS